MFTALTLPVLGTHTLYDGEGRGGGLADPSPMISKTVASANFNFRRPLGLSMRGKKLMEFLI